MVFLPRQYLSFRLHYNNKYINYFSITFPYPHIFHLIYFYSGKMIQTNPPIMAHFFFWCLFPTILISINGIEGWDFIISDWLWFIYLFIYLFSWISIPFLHIKKSLNISKDSLHLLTPKKEKEKEDFFWNKNI